MSIVSLLQGGLGNMLFQISTSYSLAHDHGVECGVDIVRHGQIVHPHRPATEYMDNIFRNISSVRLSNENKIYSYDSLVFKPIEFFDGMAIGGYYQCEKYFEHNRQMILDMFSPTLEQNEYINNKYQNLDTKTCIHVRRGDYLKLENYHPVCSVEYYRQAINRIGESEEFIILSNDIDWCRQQFSDLPNVEFVNGEEDYIDLYIMSKCKHNIIANSSFSWWGAWLNENNQKRVMAPSKWFGPCVPYSADDIFCSGWEII